MKRSPVQQSNQYNKNLKKGDSNTNFASDVKF